MSHKFYLVSFILRAFFFLFYVYYSYLFINSHNLLFNIFFIFFEIFFYETQPVIDQRTTPPELPIYGDPFTEIALELNFPRGNQIFLLNGKSLQLISPLDRDAENLSHIIFQVNFITSFRECQFLLDIIIRL